MPSLLLSGYSKFKVSLILSFFCQVFDNDAPATHHSRSRSVVRSVSELAAINEAEPLVSIVLFLSIFYSVPGRPRPRLHDTVFVSYRIGFISDWPSVYTIPFSFHIGLVSYRIGLLFTRYRFHSISDGPPVYTRTHQSDMLHTIFAFSNENALKVA